jgi:hypothetical protein
LKYRDPKKILRIQSRIGCEVAGCEEPHKAKGLCEKHYQRWRKHGDPEKTGLIVGNDWRRFWSKVLISDGCWVWTGTTDKDGYGVLGVDGRFVRAHRFAYELLVGPIPEGLELDHLCFNRPCVNPGDLEPVTTQENLRRRDIARTA